MLSFEFPPLTAAVLSAALLIFVLRVIGVTLATVRVLIMMRGRKLLSAAMGFFEVLVYVLAIGEVVNNLSNVWNLLGYCLGFAVGTLVGMVLEEYLALGYATVRIVSRYKGQHVAEAIREAGYGATVEWGQGRAGTVSMILVTVRRKEINAVVAVADGVDPEAFVTVEETRTIRRGYMRIARHER
ncbi:MAG: DUF5698 domain-containing protein [Candidatus Promineifilaceae bacterium]|nr:DUF5698 domain-containing protein [Candidatus Promineifilaceae bacterium]